jgi:asparagine synthase (glutamine-hydrolysing)
MSGAYVVLHPAERAGTLAPLLSAQLSHGCEPINHYADLGSALMGVVSHDKLQQGVMPRYLQKERLWGLLLGKLYAREGEPENDLEHMARLWREEKLLKELPRLNGAFFLVLWDPAMQTLVAANDRFGMYPMYWSHRNNRFCLASRMLCSVLSGALPGDWDPEGIAQLLSIDDYLGSTTLLKGASAYPQATMLVAANARLTWNRYWSYRYRSDSSTDIQTYADALGSRFVSAVQRQSAGTHRVGVTLSGGLDSRCLVAAAARSGIPLDTFTWGKPGCYDRLYALRIAKTFGANHHDCDYALDNLATRFEEGGRITEGLTNYFDCHMLAHRDVLADHADVVLNGYAGGLLVGGSYLRRAWTGPMATRDLAQLLFAWRNTMVPEASLGMAMATADQLARDELPSARFVELLATSEGAAAGDRVDRFFLENRERRGTSMGTVMMRTAVESVAPFFDYDFIDVLLAVPAEYRIEHRIYKLMMAKAFPEALRLPWQRTLLRAGAPEWAAVASKGLLKASRIVEQLLGWPRFGSRQSPVSFAKWLRGPLKPWMASVVEDTRGAEAVRPEFCREVWARHLKGEDHTRVLGAIAAIRGFAIALDKARSRKVPKAAQPVKIESDSQSQAGAKPQKAG